MTAWSQAPRMAGAVHDLTKGRGGSPSLMQEGGPFPGVPLAGLNTPLSKKARVATLAQGRARATLSHHWVSLEDPTSLL